MKERRLLQQIYYDILQSILRINTSVKPTKLTTIQAGSNLAYDKLKQHVNSLIRYNLLTKDYTITKKGYCYIESFTQWLVKFNQINAILHDKSYTVKVQAATINNINDIKVILDSLKMQMDKIDDWTKAQSDNR